MLAMDTVSDYWSQMSGLLTLVPRLICFGALSEHHQTK